MKLMLTAVAAAVGLAVFTAGLLVVFADLRLELAGSGLLPIVSFGDTDEHFDALELNRSQHYSRLLPAGPPPAAEAAAGAADPAPPADVYWTDFRGPQRDGRYTQTPVLTSWPAAGLEPLWSQPIGGGYASFVVAQGRAFTIEQRRQQEVVAAYDAATGRELWDPRLGRALRRGHGRTRAARDADLARGPRLRAGRDRPPVGARRRHGDVLWQRDILRDAGGDNLTWASPRRRSSSTTSSWCSPAAPAAGRWRRTTGPRATSSGARSTTSRPTPRR